MKSRYPVLPVFPFRFGVSFLKQNITRKQSTLIAKGLLGNLAVLIGFLTPFKNPANIQMRWSLGKDASTKSSQSQGPGHVCYLAANPRASNAGLGFRV